MLHVARRMIRSLLSHPDMPKVSLEGVKAFLCAALLHDTGHFPYTHSLKELPLDEHEQLTGKIIVDQPVAGILKEKLGIDPAMAAAIVDLNLDDQGIQEIAFFRRILSSPLDPDKLDYLNRDAYFCGVPYGIQDTDFVLSQILPNPAPGPFFGPGLLEGGISALENLLFSKYLMYRAVYWHRSVRIATGMIKKALYLGLANGSLQASELYGLDDDRFNALFEKKDDKVFKLISAVQQRELFQTVIELPYKQELHAPLEDLENRELMEQRIASRLGQLTGQSIDTLQVLIDIPEAISFEVDLPVFTAKGWVPYCQSRSVFTAGVVKDFTQALRLIRVALAPATAALPGMPKKAEQAARELLSNGLD
ncbi:MAG: hypothetical protein D6B26_08195 [Spirochaetaceae bacterium]|nr:MAG: hypothetical protein D6B26_08195 [Spirochaetaceae bacterium]